MYDREVLPQAVRSDRAANTKGATCTKVGGRQTRKSRKRMIMKRVEGGYRESLLFSGASGRRVRGMR